MPTCNALFHICCSRQIRCTKRQEGSTSIGHDSNQDIISIATTESFPLHVVSSQHCLNGRREHLGLKGRKGIGVIFIIQFVVYTTSTYLRRSLSSDTVRGDNIVYNSTYIIGPSRKNSTPHTGYQPYWTVDSTLLKAKSPWIRPLTQAPVTEQLWELDA